MSTGILTTRTLECGSRTSWKAGYAALLFGAMLGFVSGVSVYDGYLVVRTGEEIRDFEKNPVGLWLIEANQGNPVIFLAAKAIGTLIVLGIMISLFRRAPRIAFPVACALVTFQFSLLVFLERAGG